MAGAGKRRRRFLANDTIVSQTSTRRTLERVNGRDDVVKLVRDAIYAFADDADLEAIEVRVWVQRKPARRTKA